MACYLSRTSLEDRDGEDVIGRAARSVGFGTAVAMDMRQYCRGEEGKGLEVVLLTHAKLRIFPCGFSLHS